MKKYKKLGYITIEAIIIAAITIVMAYTAFLRTGTDMGNTVNDIGNEVSASDSYMGSQIKDAYHSDYSGVDLDAGWNNGSSAQQGSTVPIYTMVETIRTSQLEYEIEVGQEIDINVEVYPTNASQQILSWKVLSGKDRALITRDDNGHYGTVLAQKAGMIAIQISATDGGGEKTIIYISVRQPVTGLTLDKENTTITLSYSGMNTSTVKATVLPETGDSTATEKRVSWAFGNGGANSECFEMTPNHSNNTLTVGLVGSAVKSYCVGKTALITATTDDGGFQKSFYVTAAE